MREVIYCSLMWYYSCIQCHQIWCHTAKIPFLCFCWTCDYQDAFLFWMFCHTMSTEYLLQYGHPYYVEWVFFGTWIVCHTHYKQNHKSLLWILCVLGDLGGLKGKTIAHNMGTKIWLIEHIYFVIFCAGLTGSTLNSFRTRSHWYKSKLGEISIV